MRRGAQATPAQLGVANDPRAHDPGVLPSGVAEMADDDEFVSGIPDVATPGERMRWRGAQRYAPPIGPPTDQAGSDGQQPGAHATAGRPDTRRVWGASTPAGYSGGGAVGETEPSPEVSANGRVAEPVGPQSPPVRHRGGPTSDDPARPAHLALAMYSRPFDTGMGAQHFGSIGRLEMDSPRAAQPWTAAQDAYGREPSAGGGMAVPGIGPYAGAAPNSFRLLPRPWDELLINTGEGSATYDGARRVGGWRARG